MPLPAVAKPAFASDASEEVHIDFIERLNKGESGVRLSKLVEFGSLVTVCACAVANLYTSPDPQVKAFSAKELARVRDKFANLDHIVDTCASELAETKSLKEQLGRDIGGLQQDIARISAQLERAKRVRETRDETETLARQVGTLPSTRQSVAAIASLNEEIKALEAQRDRANGQVEARRKQCRLLVHAVKDLEASLQEQEQQEEAVR
jgi:uncharacterized small protein (DUF1192 family)